MKLGWSNIRKVWLDGNFLTGTIPVSWLIGRTNFGKEEFGSFKLVDQTATRSHLLVNFAIYIPLVA